MKKQKNSISIILMLLIICLIYNANLAYAATFSTDFEQSNGYNIGTLNGQNGWIGNNSYQVSTNFPASGTQNIVVSDGNISWKQIGKSFEPQIHGDMTFYMAQKYDDRYASGYSLSFNNGGSQVASDGAAFQSFAVGWNSNNPYSGIHAGQLGFAVNTPDNGWIIHDMQSFSAMTYYKIRVKWDTDAGIVSVSINDGPFTSATIENFPIDTYEIQFRSSDASDLAYFDNLSDVVASPEDKISNLINTINNFGIDRGITNSLNIKLQNAKNSLSSHTSTTCNILNAFSNEVKAQIGHSITVEQSDQLNTQVQEIEISINCQ